MRYTQHLFTFFLVLMILASSCSYKKKNILFKTGKKIKSDSAIVVVNIDSLKAVSNYKHVIKVGDRIQLRFLNNYDLGQGANQSATAAFSNERNDVNNIGYLVNYDSTVILPLIGRTNIVGKDRLEAAKFLENKYSEFITNPIIDVNIPNLTATVLGEVNTQGLIVIDKESTTLAELIAKAGGFKDTGRKDRLKIIRGNEVIVVNMKMIEALKSPDIIIHNNDIVYVEPYTIKAATEPLAGAQVATALFFSLVQMVIIGIQISALTSK
jgi:polysaccharide export outer membrane protein